METVELRLPNTLVAKLQFIADQSGVTIEQVIAVLLVVGLPNLDKCDG